jgi:hypothetical protein
MLKPVPTIPAKRRNSMPQPEIDPAPIEAELAAISELEHRIRVAHRSGDLTEATRLEADRYPRAFATVQSGPYALLTPLSGYGRVALSRKEDAEVVTLPVDYWDLAYFRDQYASLRTGSILSDFIQRHAAIWVQLPGDVPDPGRQADAVIINPGSDPAGPVFIRIEYADDPTE